MDVAFVKALIAWKEKKEVIYGCRAVRANLRKNLLIHLDCISGRFWSFILRLCTPISDNVRLIVNFY